MPYKIEQEVTGNELQIKYTIVSSRPKVRVWVKDIVLLGESKYEGKLFWDADDGYRMIWYTPAPPEADRPEFEYILDSLTRQDYC